MAPRRDTTRLSKAHLARQTRPRAVDFMSESGNAEPDDDDDAVPDADSDEDDMDVPRVAQWIDDDELELREQSDDASSSLDDKGPSLQSLEDDLSTLPLGTLRSAQRSLAQARAFVDDESDQSESDPDPSGDDDDDDDDVPPPPKGKVTTPDRPSKPKTPAKRTNKHAPVQVTSKRPVSRRRIVVDDKLPKPRDPRFMHAAGRYDPSKFRQQYDFLSGLRNDELSVLDSHVKRARKLLANSPADLRAERDQEVKRLERAMKRAESSVNQDNRERVELEALRSAKQAEKDKRRRGKAEWWMKRSEKKKLLANAHLDAIKAAGGKLAVKKALDKKQKKIAQKEKKMRPFPRTDGKKRGPTGSIERGRESKRRKVV